MPILWGVIAGVLTFIFSKNHSFQPIFITNILLGIIVGLLFERRNLEK
ncbi:hypothetical protein [Bacillus sp. OAE603]